MRALLYHFSSMVSFCQNRQEFPRRQALPYLPTKEEIGHFAKGTLLRRNGISSPEKLLHSLERYLRT